jgi:hypothetical protein
MTPLAEGIEGAGAGGLPTTFVDDKPPGNETALGGLALGGACVVMDGWTVEPLDTDWPAGMFVPVSESAPAVGTSTTTAHLGQRAFLPAYFASTLNFAEQAGQRQTTSDMLTSNARKSGGSDAAER